MHGRGTPRDIIGGYWSWTLISKCLAVPLGSHFYSVTVTNDMSFSVLFSELMLFFAVGFKGHFKE